MALGSIKRVLHDSVGHGAAGDGRHHLDVCLEAVARPPGELAEEDGASGWHRRTAERCSGFTATGKPAGAAGRDGPDRLQPAARDNPAVEAKDQNKLSGLLIPLPLAMAPWAMTAPVLLAQILGLFFKPRTAGLRRRAGDHSTAGTTGGAAGLGERWAVS